MYERELLAVIKALNHWKAYLKWTTRPFTIYTDHANLLYWKATHKLNRRTARWHAELQDYHFKLEHVAGKAHQAADALSRPEGVDKGDKDNEGVIMLPPHIFVKFVTTLMDRARQKEALKLHHDSAQAGHPGQDETL